MFKFLIVVIVGMFLIISLPQNKKPFLDSGVRDNIVETLKEIK
jgi:hypothetical protein